MATDKIGLYVHIPFCASKCKYCDFASFVGVVPTVREQYIDRLCEELRDYKTEPKTVVDTIFFGGGTPTLILPDEFEKIVNQIRKTFDVLVDCEFTVEANPKTVTKEALSVFVRCGVNRISFGAQSFCDNELKILGRIHLNSDISASVKLARDAGINNISLDLMYGIPEQSIDTFEESVNCALKLTPTHISAYGLIIEEGTPFFVNRNQLKLPSEDEECDMYYAALSRLTKEGFVHYEISNYALPGFECRHNLKYWRDEEFIGVGLSAYSYYQGKRYGNTANLDEYLSPRYKSHRCVETIDKDVAAFEYAMMHLRLREGFSFAEYIELFGVDFRSEREEKINKFSRLGLISCDEKNIRLTDKGFYVSNTILSELL